MLTNFIDYVESIITEATQMSELVRIVRKPRVHKEKPPMVVARKIVFRPANTITNIRRTKQNSCQLQRQTATCPTTRTTS